MSTVTAILFGRTCWANALAGSELSSNNRRFFGWTPCYPSNFCEPYGKYTNFCSIEAKVTQKLAECHCDVKCGKSWKTSKNTRKSSWEDSMILQNLMMESHICSDKHN